MKYRHARASFLLFVLMAGGGFPAGTRTLGQERPEYGSPGPTDSGGLGTAKNTEIVIESAMEGLGRMTKAHKLVGAILREMPSETHGTFIAGCLDKLKKVKELGEPLQKVMDAQKIIEGLQRGEYRPKAHGLFAGSKDEIRSMAERLEKVHVDQDWERLLRPEAIRPEDIEAAETSLASPLRESVTNLLADWKRREARQEYYKECQRIVLAYRKELMAVESFIESKGTNPFIWNEQFDLLEIVLPAWGNSAASFKRLYDEEGYEISRIKQQYSLRSKTVDVIDLKKAHEIKEAQFDKQIVDRKKRLQDLQSQIRNRQADVRGIGNGIVLEEHARGRYQALANEPYTLCPNGEKFENCIHTELKARYVKMKEDNLKLARQAADRKAGLGIRLREAESTLERLSFERENVSAQIAGAEDARKKAAQNYYEAMTRVCNEARKQYSRETEELRRQQFAQELRELEQTDADSLILQEARSRAWRRLLNAPSKPSGSGAQQNPFGSAAPEKSPGGLLPHDTRNPFAPARPAPGVDDNDRNPFRP
jgi:hypothetical protein